MKLSHLSPVQYWFINIDRQVFKHKNERHDAVVIKKAILIQSINKIKEAEPKVITIFRIKWSFTRPISEANFALS